MAVEKLSRRMALFLFFGILLAISASAVAWALPFVPMNPDPVEVCWYLTDADGSPVDGAELKVYWAESPDGPFTLMPEDDGAGTYVLDRIAGVRQNPLYSGYWNPDYPHGMIVADIHPGEGLSGLFFYAKIEYDSVEEYWPVATSYKPGDPLWAPVEASGSPSGFAASGPGIGTGPTTAYPNRPCPPHVVPEVPVGTIMAAVSMMVAFGAYLTARRQKISF